jgi:hypothetical protein
MTVEDLNHIHGVSRERVRQIEVRAFGKLQKAMLTAAAAPTASPEASPDVRAGARPWSSRVLPGPALARVANQCLPAGAS